MARILAFTLGLALLAGALATPAAAEIYKWTDADGKLHFSDQLNDVPEQYRPQTARALEPAEGGEPGFAWGNEGDLPVLPGEADGTAESEGDSAVAPDLGFDAEQAQEMLSGFEGPMLIVVIVVALTIMGFALAFWAVCLVFGARMGGVESPGFKKAYGIVMVFFLAGLVVQPGVILILGQPEGADIGHMARFQLASFAVTLLVQAAILRGMLCDGFGRSLIVAITTNLVVLMVGFLFGIAAFCAGFGMATLA